jgi:hypothetical protein
MTAFSPAIRSGGTTQSGWRARQCGLQIDLALALVIACAQLLHPAGSVRAVFELLRQPFERQSRVTNQCNVGSPVEPRIPGAAVGRNQRRRAPHMASVVEAEIARHAGQQHAIGFAQRVAPRVTHLQRVVRPK